MVGEMRGVELMQEVNAASARQSQSSASAHR